MTKRQAAALGIDLKFAEAQQKRENQIKAIRGFIAQVGMRSLSPPSSRPAGNRG